MVCHPLPPPPLPLDIQGPLTNLFFCFSPSIEGRWLLTIVIPPTYPHAPPTIRFLTPIVHPNIHLDTGEICLDLLKDAWTPAYSILETVRAIRDGLLAYPEVDSPLNVDAAALLRSGDEMGAKRLVELWCAEGRYNGA